MKTAKTRIHLISVCFCLLFSVTAFAIDTDGDGVDDSVDAFPNDAAAAVDTDGDGKPDSFLFAQLETFSSMPSGWAMTSKVNVSSGYATLTYSGIETTTLQTPQLRTGSTVSFSYQVSWNSSQLAFYIDGVKVTSPAINFSSTSWQGFTITVSPGLHIFKWTETGRSFSQPGTSSIDNVYFGAPATNLVLDDDDDNDGVLDVDDAFPLDASESIDTDHDGIGNNADWDDDNDGVPDVVDAAPLNAGDTSEITLPINSVYKGVLLQSMEVGQ